MADFDQFTSAEPAQPPEEDPAAAFLAREQDDLAELEQDNFDDKLPPQADPGSQDNYGGMAQEEDFFGGAQDPAAVAPTSSAPVDDMFDPLGDTVPEDTNINTNETFGADMSSEPSDPYASVKHVDRVRQEPEKIKKWREEQAERLEKKDAASALKEGEWREIAKKELEDWYKHRAEQFEKTKKTNRETEDVFIRERDESLPGDEWERICRLCDFNPKSSRTNKDISRMRSILLQLKQNPLQRS